MEIYAVCYQYDEGGPVAPIALFSSPEGARKGLKDMVRAKNEMALTHITDQDYAIVGPYILDPSHITLHGESYQRSEGSTYMIGPYPIIPEEIQK